MWPHAPKVCAIGIPFFVRVIARSLEAFPCLAATPPSCSWFYAVTVGLCVFSSLIDRRGWLSPEEMIPAASASETEPPRFAEKNDAEMVG